MTYQDFTETSLVFRAFIYYIFKINIVFHVGQRSFFSKNYVLEDLHNI
jgi:hypothetical protein